jgi:uncharacterized protein YyaL (SSP411 family)
MHVVNHRFVQVLIIVFTFSHLFAQKEDSLLKGRILNAMHIGAEYACNVLLDEQGKSRCDYNVTEGRWYEYEPPWHTGQIIYALVETYQITKEVKYLDAAKRAGDWWVSLEIKDHTKLKGMIRAAHGDYIGDVIVFATVSDGSAGLFRLFEVTGEKKYAQAPTNAGEWMLQNMYVPEKGVFYDSVDPKSGEVLKENSPFWRGKKEQTLYDVARPNNEGSIFKDMYEFTLEPKYKEVFIELCESLLEKQGPEGLWMDFMPNHKAEGSFHPRFNLWYAESLIEGFELTGDRRYLEAAAQTARMFIKVQKGDGTIYYKNYLDGRSNQNSVCGSAVAFAGIIWLRLSQYVYEDEFKGNIQKSLDWLLKNRFSQDHPDKNLAGATINIRTRRKKGKIWMTNRDIGTSFALRFLADYYRSLEAD